MQDTAHHLSSASRDYDRIEVAIRYLEENFQLQPNLDEIAAATGLSPGVVDHAGCAGESV